MLPAVFSERMRRLLGAEFDAFLASYDRPRNTALRRNPALPGPALPQFCGERVAWEPNGFYLLPDTRPGLSPLHDAGLFYLQEPSAMAPARLLDAQPEERVLDLCAAPGGKSTQLAAAMRGQGLLVCNELHPKRARILASNLERWGATNALVLNEHPARLAERFPAFFDRILVDAPCSGEGMFRKEDAAVADWSEETVRMCADRQAEILRSAAQMLAPGGRLVYSTCTFAPEENEGSVSRLLRVRPDFSVETVDAPWFDRGRPEWLADPAPGLEHTFRLWPHKLRGEGHYAAVLRRAEIGARGDIPQQRLVPLPDAVRDFLRLLGTDRTHGLAFGETWYLPPAELPALDGLHVLNAGLRLGEVRRGRFVPAHALAHGLTVGARRVSYPADAPETAAYLRGETLPGDAEGWVVICADGCSLGWAKGAGGVLKNHYPKGLRRLK